MASKTMEITISLSFFATILISTLPLATVAQFDNCTDEIKSLSPCFDYIQERDKFLPPDCCDSLDDVVESKPNCLCQVLRGDEGVNRTRFSELPSVIFNQDVESSTDLSADSCFIIIVALLVRFDVVGEYGRPSDVKMTKPGSVLEAEAITIGEALEATALSAGDKPVDVSDAAAIAAAEVRATGLGHVVPGGVAAEAQSAAAYNLGVTQKEDKAKLGDILADATTKLTDDKAVTREDAEGVIFAEVRNKADMATHPGGVAASVAAAARLNQEK
ncbi:lipid-transfer protein [Striga asiatica]|uniref:Lipid-transfer protein n=1 Tax=Striga asiatica TaxID=4170 RepID=A0A5A7RCG0_STRAF|nr:lipid-transfer protein [Striga asiatica]